MKLSSMTQENLLLLKSNVTSKNEAIDVLLNCFEERYNPTLDYSIVKNKIMEREELGSTTYDNGLTIPHTRIEEIDDVVFGILTPEIPFEDNGVMVNMVIMILSSSSTSSVYLKVLSSLMTIFGTAELISQYTTLNKTADFLAKIRENDVALTTELKVEDVINKEFIYLSPNDTVEEAIHMMSRTNIACLPVCSEGNIYEGVVHFNDIIALGVPQYAQMLTSMKFVSSIDPMEQLFINEDKILVENIMNKQEVTMNYDSYLIEVFLFMIKEKKLFIPVLNGKECVGIIDYTCLINNYLRV